MLPLFFFFFLIFPSATQNKAFTCTGSALQQAVHGCFHLSLPILGAGPKCCAKQTSLCFSSECIGTDADTSEAQRMHSTLTSVSLTALAIKQCFFSTLNRVNNMDQKSSSLSHRFNIAAPLAYTFPAQIKGIITLFCGICCNALGLYFCEITRLKTLSSNCLGIQKSIQVCGHHSTIWVSIWL